MASTAAYDLEIVARTIFEGVLRLYPQRLTVAEFSLRILGDPEDEREVETAAKAFESLRASGLIRYRNNDRLVEPTQAVLRYVALMGSP